MAKIALPLPSVEELQQLLSYNPETGAFVWKVQIGRSRVGMVAGSTKFNGYIGICIARRLMYGHRLAWKMVYGEDPPAEIDHINGDRGDTRIANLRLASREQNAKNLPKHCRNKSGIKGVSWNKKSGKWQAQIMSDRQWYRLGEFSSKWTAYRKYSEASSRLHKDFSRGL